MRITRPLSFIAKQMAKTIAKKTILVSFGFTLLASGVIASQNLLTTPDSANAATPPDSCFAFNAGTGTITDYYNNEGNNPANPACPKAVDIPGTIGGVTVTVIGNAAYPGAFTSKGLTSVTIPSGVTSIGYYAFFMNQLTSVTIPNSVASIGHGAFYGNQLSSATISNSATSFSNQVFANNKFTTLPDFFSQPSVTRIPDSMFEGNQFTTLTIPSNIKTIAYGAFASNNLTAVTFLGSVTTFASDIFRDNLLTQITYGGITYTDSIPLVDQCYAFSSGTITEYKLYDMNLIKNSGIACMKHDVVIPSTIGGVSVTTISNGYPGAFGRKGLTSVTIPNSVTSIGYYAFFDNKLTTITIPNSVTNIGASAFFNNQLTNITIPNSVTSIGDSAFFSNQLTNITIPNRVTSISSYTFYANQLTSITIPNSVTSIGDRAFFSNKLTTVTIPNSVTSIGDSAFEWNQLASVAIPNSITSIGASAFSGNRLTTVTIPNSVVSIGDKAFSSNWLATVTILNPSVVAHGGSFVRNPIESITLGTTTHTQSPGGAVPEACFDFDAGTGTINAYFSYNISVLQSTQTLCGRNVDIPSTIGGVPVTTIGYDAFGYAGLTNVTIPDSVTTIDDWAFEANNLTTLALPAGITTIGEGTFANNKLSTVTIPNSITSIHPTAFFGQNPWGGVVDSGWDPTRDWYSDDPAVRKTVFDNIWYVRLYTADPINPNGLKDGITNEDWYGGEDLNNDGDQQDSIGGHLINPGNASIHYRNSTGSNLAPAETLTGSLTDGTKLQDYLVKNVTVPALVDSAAPTPTEQSALDQALSVYYRAGSTQTFTPPAIAGSVTPAPQAKTLVAGDNTLDFTYNQPVLSVPFVSNDVTDGVLVPSTTPGSVASPLLSESKLSIANDNTCSTIQSAELLAPGSVSAPQGITMLGGLGFTLDCTTAATTTVSLTLGSQANPDTLRVYKDIAGTLTDITSHMTFTTNNGKTILTYNLTDGGALDEDDAANGTIVDPIYIGVAGSGELASTGINATMVVAVGVVTLAAGIAFAMRRDVVRAPIRTRQ